MTVTAPPPGWWRVDRPLTPIEEALSGSFAEVRPTAAQASARTASKIDQRIRSEVGGAKKLLDRMTRARRDAGRRLIAGAEIAFAEALRLAGIRAQTKARNKSGTTLARTVAQASLEGLPLRPFLAALGVSESDLLGGAFVSYQTQSAAWLAQRREEIRAMLDDEGFDPDEFLANNNTDDLAAAAFLAAALLALARQRILGGLDPLTLNSPGEVSGAVPAGIIMQALSIADGTAHLTHAGTPDELPSVINLTDGALETQVANALRDRLVGTLRAEIALVDPNSPSLEEINALDAGTDGATEYLWVHGFYGDPIKEFEPHASLDGVLTTSPDQDAVFVNDGDWPDTDHYYPGDHLGCSCELVAQIGTGFLDLATRVAALAPARVAGEGPGHDFRGNQYTGGIGGIVTDLTARARFAEPGVTRDLQDAAKRSGATLSGLDFRLKSSSSLMRKISEKVNSEGLTPAQAGASIKDALRYTALYGPEGYVAGYGKLAADLKAKGYQENEEKNFWQPGDPYSGLNTVWTTPGGQRFELQIHTPDSFATKEAIHPMYEEYRLPTTPPERRQELYVQMSSPWDAVKIPPGVLSVGTSVFQAAP